MKGTFQVLFMLLDERKFKISLEKLFQCIIVHPMKFVTTNFMKILIVKIGKVENWNSRFDAS